MQQIASNGFERISKTRANKMWKEGISFYVCPNKLRPFVDEWGTALIVEPDETKDFNAYINRATFFNCNSETGKRLSYYIKENKGDK